MPALVVTAAVGAMVALSVPPVHSATGTFVLVPEDPQAVEEARLAQGGIADSQLRLAAGILAEVISGPEIADRLREDGATASYRVETDGTGGLLRVTAFGSDRDAVITTGQLVVDAIVAELASRQEGGEAGISQDITPEILARPDTARPVQSTTDPDQPTFAANGSVLLRAGAASEGGTPVGSNPFSQLGLAAPAIISEFARAPDFRERVGEVAPGDFQVNADPNAPVLRTYSTADSQDEAAATVEAVFAELEDILQRRQVESNAPRSTWIALDLLSQPVTDTAPGSRVRPLIAVVGLGLIGTIGLAVVFEGLSARRRPSGPGTGTADPDIVDLHRRSRDRLPGTDGSGSSGSPHTPRQTSDWISGLSGR